MRIYKLVIQDTTLHLRSIVKSDLIKRLKDNSPNRFDNWTIPDLEQMEINHEGYDQLCDVTSIDSATNYPLFSSKVKSTLVEKCGITEQWLDVNYPGKPYSLLNLTHTISAIDHDLSDIRYFKCDGKQKGIESYAFKSEVIEKEWAFKDPIDRQTLFFTSRFAELADQEGWTGFNLTPVWDSNHEPFPKRPSRKIIKERPDVYGPEGFIRVSKEYWPDEWKDSAKSQKSKN